MAVGRQIYELHLLDSSILDADAELASVTQRLGDESEVTNAEAELKRAQDALGEVERRQREIESHISDIQERLGPLEKRTFDGSVTNSRELEGMQREVENQQRRLSEAEDSYLLILDEHDAASKVAAEKGSQRSEVKKRRKSDVKTLANEKDEIEFHLLELWEKRDGRAEALDAEPKRLYESLRETLGGLAVATIGRGMCNKCRISLPMNVVQKARAAKEISQCPNCTRILCFE